MNGKRRLVWSTDRIYDILIEPLVGDLRKTGLELYPPRPGMYVLDIGCGTGTTLALYQKAGCRVAGIDTSAGMLEAARRKLGGEADLRLGSAAQMPFPDGEFDLVTETLAFHEMSPKVREGVFLEMVRVVKKDGRILLTDYHAGQVPFPMGWFSKIFITLIEFTAGREHFRNYRGFLARQGLQPLIRTYQLSVRNQQLAKYGSIAFYLLSHDG